MWFWDFLKRSKKETSTPSRGDAIADNFEPFITTPGSYMDASNGFSSTPARYSWNDGSKFPGGFGVTELYLMDYWTLRARSRQLFTNNIYARGLVRRLVTNVINTGLTLESIPEETVIGLPEDSLEVWAEDIENRWSLYANDPEQVDYCERITDGELQAEAYLEALISGDVLIVQTINKKFNLPQTQLIIGDAVCTPTLTKLKINTGHTIIDGVELDAKGRQVAYWVNQKNNGAATVESKRIPAKGPKSGRRIAWLYYGSDKLHNSVRGVPFLGIMLQSLKELDRYRDAAQRKAVINSILTMFVEKGENKMSTNPFSGGAIRSDQVEVTDDGNTSPRLVNLQSQIPGLVLEELQTGETIKAHDSNGVELHLGEFEAAVVQAMSWCAEVPPEIVQLAFSNNYSASQAAINEFKIFLNKERTRVGRNLMQPRYVDWLVSMVLGRKINAPDFLTVWRDPDQREKFNAYVASDWSGAIKPSTDIRKQTQGYKEMTNEGWITNDRAARELTGTKFSKNARRLQKENQLKADMMRPILELNNEFGEEKVDALVNQMSEKALEYDEGTIFTDDEGTIWAWENGKFVEQD